MLKKVIRIIPLIAVCAMFVLIMPSAVLADADDGEGEMGSAGWAISQDTDGSPWELSLKDGPVKLAIEMFFVKPEDSFTYQWLHDGEIISGATDREYMAKEGGSYICRVTDAVGETKEVNFYIYSWWLEYGNNGEDIVRMLKNGAVSLQVALKGADQGQEFSYKWKYAPWEDDEYSWSVPEVIDGANGPSYSATEPGHYSCTVTAPDQSEKTVYFGVYRWMVEVPENVTLQNGSAQIRADIVSETDGISFSYQWYENGPDEDGYYVDHIIQGATSPELTVTHGGYYRCHVTGSDGGFDWGSVYVKEQTKPAKKAQPMTVKTTAKTVKVKALKKKAQTVAPITVKKAQGKVTYKLISGNAKSKKALKLNTKNGKVAVKKGTKKGKYNLKVKVSAAGTTAYKAGSKTVTITIKVK